MDSAKVQKNKNKDRYIRRTIKLQTDREGRYMERERRKPNELSTHLLSTKETTSEKVTF